VTNTPLDSTILYSMILGIVQGATEFLPVSSTAHLILIPAFLKTKSALLNSAAFDVALHTGTLAAVLAVFGREWLHLLGSLGNPRSVHNRTAWGLLVATVPAVVAGGLAADFISVFFRSHWWVAVWLAAGAVVLWVADRKSKGRMSTGDVTMTMALLVGLAQTLALLPGFSRSGATMTAALLLGLSRSEAAKYSFLLSAPVIAAASLWGAVRLTGTAASDWPVILAGMICAAGTGMLAIKWLLKAIGRMSFGPFVYYRLIIAALIIIWAVWGGFS